MQKMLFGFPVLAMKICNWFEPGSTKIVNGLQGAAKRGLVTVMSLT